MISTQPSHSVPTWVDAAPFRAHLLQLHEITGGPWQVIALSAGLTVSLATSLVEGRGGRPLRRLPREAAYGLLGVTAQRLTKLDSTRVDAAPTCRRLTELSRRGFDPAQLALRMGVPLDVSAVLLTGTAHRISARWALGVLAAHATADKEAVSGARYAPAA